MDKFKARRIRHFLHLTYPLHVVIQATEHCLAHYPDLPQCQVQTAPLTHIYNLAETARRQWLTTQVLLDEPIPLPNAVAPRPTGC